MSFTEPPPPFSPSDYTPARDHLQVSASDDGVVTVSLSNPERRNAMSAQMTQAWGRLMCALAGSTAVRCVVVTGEGSAFCSGGDTGWIGSEPGASVDALRRRMIPFYRTWLSVRDLPVPVIAGINGPAVGAGACLALAADVRIAAPEARFSVPFLRLGMHAGMATTYLLPEIVGVAAARDLLFTGRSVDADGMQRLGLVSEVVPTDQFSSALNDMAAAVAGNAPIATRLTKEILRGRGPQSLEESIQWESLAQPITLATEDLQEGLAAARERRAPQFKDR